MQSPPPHPPPPFLPSLPSLSPRFHSRSPISATVHASPPVTNADNDLWRPSSSPFFPRPGRHMHGRRPLMPPPASCAQPAPSPSTRPPLLDQPLLPLPTKHHHPLPPAPHFPSHGTSQAFQPPASSRSQPRPDPLLLLAPSAQLISLVFPSRVSSSFASHQSRLSPTSRKPGRRALVSPPCAELHTLAPVLAQPSPSSAEPQPCRRQPRPLSPSMSSPSPSSLLSASTLGICYCRLI